MKIRLNDILPINYERLGAKLFHLCREHTEEKSNITLASAFANNDPCSGTAILWLIKHFGCYPIEIGRHNGEIDLNETLWISGISDPTRLIIIVQALPLLDSPFDKSAYNSSTSAVDSQTLDQAHIHSHLPTLVGIKSSFSKITSDMLFNQITINSRFLIKTHRSIKAPIVYVAGFNREANTEQNDHLSPANFLPWYVQIINKESALRIVRQPDLDPFLAKIPSSNPYVLDLEQLMGDMELGTRHDE